MLSDLVARSSAQWLARRITTSAVVAADVPAIMKQVKKEPSLFNWLGWSYPERTKETLDKPFPHVASITPSTYPKEKPKSQLTTLDNGIRIITEKAPGATGCIAFFVDTGSIYETPPSAGITHLMEQMAWKATIHRTHFRIVRESEALGANVNASASREMTNYNIEFVQSHLPAALELITDAVLNPRLQYWETRDTFESLKKTLPENLKKNQMLVLNENLHAAAYQGGLGRPLVCPDYANLNFEIARQWFEEHYNAKRIVIAVGGMFEHQEVVDILNPLVSTMPGVPKPETPKSVYIGGEHRQQTGGPMTNMVLAFEYKGGWKDMKNSVVASVVQGLLGGGGAFSAGGPGKGMYTRLYRNVLSKHSYVHHCVAYSSLYAEQGLMGVHATCDYTQAEAALNLLGDELTALTKLIGDEELSRAKTSTISNVLMNLENKSVLVDDMARQVYTFGNKKPVEEFFKVLRGITSNDVNQFVSKLLKTKPTIASIGELQHVPRYSVVERKFGV